MQAETLLQNTPDELLDFALSLGDEFEIRPYRGGLLARKHDGTMLLDVTASPHLYGPQDQDTYEDLDFEIAENGTNAITGIDGDWCWTGDELTGYPHLEVLVCFPDPVHVN